MGRRTTRSRHRVPVEQLGKSAILTPEYAAEVEEHTAALQRRWEKAQKALAAAQARRERIERRIETERRRATERREAEERAALEEAEQHRAETLVRLAREREEREWESIRHAHRRALEAAVARVSEAEREVLDIEALMMPGTYAGREHRGTRARAKHRA